MRKTLITLSLSAVSLAGVATTAGAAHAEVRHSASEQTQQAPSAWQVDLQQWHGDGGHGYIKNQNVPSGTFTKGGIKMLTRAMTAEWASAGLQANAIGPGYMLTDMNEALVNNEAFNAWVIGRTPAARWGSSADLVGPTVWLASPASHYVNGQTIFVDGGMTAVV